MRRSFRHSSVMGNLFLITVAVLTFLPFYFMLITSVKTTSQMRHYFLSPTWPLHLTNYVIAFRQIVRYLLNTMIVASITVPGVVLFSSLSAFAFARYSFPGRTVLFYAVISMLMVPGILTLVPAFIWIKQLGLLNTYWALVLPYIASGQVFAIYLLRSFFATLPEELFDSAYIDGASRLEVYRHIALPLVKPMISTVAILSILSTWNDYIWPLVTLQNDKMRTLTIGLRYFQGQFHTNYGPLFAGYILGSLPLLVAFLIGMRSFIAGLTAGAIKM
jgi:multiple sugar transport system permease protein/raffinose/stachyose/melibiose transport system permease protein